MFKIKDFAFLTIGLLAVGAVRAQQVCPSTSPVVKETSASGHSNVGITPPNVLILNRSWQNPRALLAGFAERAKTTLNAQYPGCGILITNNGSGVSDDAGGGTVKLAATHTAGCDFTQSLAEFWYNVVLSQLPECIPGYTLSADGHSCSSQEDTLLLCTSSVSPSTVDPARTMSECTDTCAAGNPTNVATGNKFQIEADLQATEADSLEFIRYYNSSPLTVTSRLGPGWRHTFDRQLVFSGNPANSSTVPVVASVLRPDGRVIRFNVSNDGVIPTYPDLTEILNKQSNGTWVFTDENDTVETYPAPAALGNGQYSSLVSTIKFRSGLTQSLSYNGDKLVSVEDSFKHKLNFSYDSSQRLSSVSPVYRSGDPDAGTTIAQYSYGANGMLASVAYPSSGSTTRDYGYAQLQSPGGVWNWYLSNIKDENTGLIRSRWEYDAQGRVIKGAKTSGELDVYNFSYGSNNGILESSVTLPNGAYSATSSYEFDTIQGLPRLTDHSGTSSISLTRDAQTGRTTSSLKGLAQTDLEYDSRGRITRKSEAVGTLNARTTRIAWHPTLRVPTEIKEYANGTGTGTPVRIETYELDGKGAITNRSEQDPAAGISRAWGITRTPYGRPLVVDGPASDSDIVRFTYYSCTQGEQGYECGRLKTYSNERSKVTTYSNYTVFGKPKTILDPNNVTTQIT